MIEWTNRTWNPIVGCSKSSPGCDNCYAEKMARRLRAITDSQCCKNRSQLNLTNAIAYGTAISKKTGTWSGKTGWRRYELKKPLHWRNPRKIFVCSMGDLFHESVPFEWIDKVMAVMALCPQHTFQILTKWADRMLEYMQTEYRWRDGVLKEAEKIHSIWQTPLKYLWPQPHIWLGVTAENQEQANRRIPLLMQTPAAVRFVSIEPMLEEIDLTDIATNGISRDALTICDTLEDVKLFKKHKRFGLKQEQHIDWVICGCESGHNRRPMDIDWAYNLMCQCENADVPLFMKQIEINGKVCKDINQFPKELQVREFPNG